jgi:hypothetical protein
MREHKYIPSTILGSAFKKAFLHKSLTVAITCPLKGPYVSTECFFSSSSSFSSALASSSLVLVGEVPETPYPPIIVDAVVSWTCSIFSIMKIAPRTGSSNKGPDIVAISNPVAIELFKSFTDTSCV